MATKYEIIVTERAESHIKESVRWYEIQKKGLGKVFFLKVKDSLKLILLNPFAYAKIHLEIRRILTKKFNHALFYHINEEEKQIVIIAVLHTSQNPEIWKDIAENELKKNK